MIILGWVIWSIGAFILLINICLFHNPDAGAGRLAKRLALLITIGLVITLFTNFSKFHLVWWIPLAMFLNIAAFQSGVYRKGAKFMEELKENKERDK